VSFPEGEATNVQPGQRHARCGPRRRAHWRAAAGGPARRPQEHGRGRRTGRPDQGLRLQAGTGPDQRLGGLADAAVRRARGLGRLAVSGLDGRGGQARCVPADRLRRRQDDRVPAYPVRREAGSGHPQRDRARWRQRSRSLLASGRRGVRLRADRPAGDHRRGQADHARPGRRVHLPGQYRAHLPRHRAGRPHPGAMGCLARPARRPLVSPGVSRRRRPPGDRRIVTESGPRRRTS